MSTHAPADYECPFCRFARGIESSHNALADIIYHDDDLLAFVAPRTWPCNAGNVLVVPRTHYENLYDVPDQLLARVAILAKQVAVAMKRAYGCDGTSLRQHNESAGGQDVWHYHVHVIPRWAGDELYRRHDEHRYVPDDERQAYAAQLRAVLESDGRAPSANSNVRE
jgi:histidine triad (HIT) family protein